MSLPSEKERASVRTATEEAADGLAGHRDVYFSMLKEEQAGMQQAARGLPQSG